MDNWQVTTYYYDGHLEHYLNGRRMSIQQIEVITKCYFKFTECKELRQKISESEQFIMVKNKVKNDVAQKVCFGQ